MYKKQRTRKKKGSIQAIRNKCNTKSRINTRISVPKMQKKGHPPPPQNLHPFEEDCIIKVVNQPGPVTHHEPHVRKKNVAFVGHPYPTFPLLLKLP